MSKQTGKSRGSVVVWALMMVLAAAVGRGAGLPAQWPGAAPNSGETFRFVVMSDNTGSPVAGEWAEAVREINLLKPDFVVSVGDLISGYITDTNEVTAMWDTFDAKIRKLDAPFFYCPGNHDVSNDAMRNIWVARYGVGGRTYYSFDYRGCHFVVLDTATPMYLPDSAFTSDFMKAQLAWLKQDLAAAANAQHVFVFSHVPLAASGWGGWRELVKLLPAGKTTVFNGHFHQLSYSAPEGIPTYILGATGALAVGGDDDLPNRELGMFRMFAQVAVDHGTPSVAVLPLHEVLPGDYVLRRFSGAFIAKTWQQKTPLSARGGTVSLKYGNDLGAPFHVAVSWNAPDWEVRPPTAAASLAPGQSTELKFVLKPHGQDPDFPSYRVAYETTDPARRQVSYQSAYKVTFPARFGIAAVRGISVDGKLGDWQGVKPYALKSKGRICVGVENWQGESDSSALIYLGHDAERLYVGLDVTDDQIAIDDKYCWANDGIEFYWDSRSAAQRDGQTGPGTGQVILPLPPVGHNPAPSWFLGGRATPKNFVAAAARRPGGYIYEFSVPLEELGAQTPVVPGETIHLEFMINDRDIENGHPTQSHLTTSGQPGSGVTSNYAECTLEK